MAHGTRKQKPCTRCGGRRLVRCIKEGKPCTRCGHLEAAPRRRLAEGMTVTVEGFGPARILSLDADPDARVWVASLENPDSDAFVARSTIR